MTNLDNNKNYDLSGKVAVVTGGGKGLGKTITEFLLRSGMKVAICGRNESTISSTVDELKSQYQNHVYGAVCDVSDSIQVTEFINQVKQTFGQIHVLINNSGFGKDCVIWQTSEADWDEVMNTNVKGAFLMCKEIVPDMIRHNEGYIVNIASQAALNGYARAAVYCASKFAMLGLGQALQEEIREYNIHVHTLNPALIQSQKGPDDEIETNLIQNEDLANTLLFLLQQPRRLKIDNIGMWGFK